MPNSEKKLIINGRFLTQKRTGVQNYAIGMIQALEKAGRSFEIASPKNHNPSAIAGFFWEQFFLPRYVLKTNGFLINLCNSAPLFLKEQAVTVHDLAFEADPGDWFRPLFRKWYKFMIPRICKNAKLVFTVSDFSKKEIQKKYAIQNAKIHIIPNGLPSFTFDKTIVIEGKYVVITGSENSRKNATWVMEQAEYIAQKGLKLVVLKTGSTAFQETDILNNKNVIFFNELPSAQYYNLLRNAEALIYPSLYEGFGIPILESLSLGTPVICNDLEVFHETFKELPLYFNVKDVESFKKALDILEKKQITEADKQTLKNNFNFEHSITLLIKSINTLN